MNEPTYSTFPNERNKASGKRIKYPRIVQKLHKK